MFCTSLLVIFPENLNQFKSHEKNMNIGVFINQCCYFLYIF